MDVSYDATKRELTTNQGTIRYHEAGADDAPPLILLHGGGSAAGPVAAALAARSPGQAGS